MCGCGVARYRPPKAQSTPQRARPAPEESSAITEPVSAPANVYVLPESGGAAPSPKKKGEVSLADVLGS